MTDVEPRYYGKDYIQRLGFDYVEDKLLHTEIDKKAILNKNVTGGATC